MELEKNIPIGSGMGGGSSNASFVLMALNNIFDLKIDRNQLKFFAQQIGSDCPFFIDNKASFISGKGEIIENINFSLSNYYIVVYVPSDISISTQLAYQNVDIKTSQKSLKNIIKQPIENWKDNIKNDFENYVFSKYPILNHIKNDFYDKGAIYASMSGTGSAIYGIFNDVKKMNTFKHTIILSQFIDKNFLYFCSSFPELAY